MKCLLTLSGLALSGPLLVAQESESRIVSPTTTANPLSIAPQIDGEVLADDAWSQVKPTSGFWQITPDEGRRATQRTEVFIGFTDTALYIGVVAYDDNPSGIIVADSRRDSSLNETDSFQVIIDGLNDRQNGFVFGTNPAGIEYDAQVTNEGSGGFRGGSGGFNLNWDTTWEVSARISDIGWSAEMEIPFSALRYGSDDIQTWGINFQRNIRRNNEVAFWAPLDRQYNINRVSEAGYVEGIRIPDQRNLQITPYALNSVSRGGSLPSGSHSNEEYGFDLKYSVTPSLILDATYNTDFAQVEVDELQVNLDRFSLFFPEKRPFFLENAGQFAVGNPREVELFFSRRIGVGAGGTQLPIEGGARLTGKIGKNTNIGLLQMRSEAVSGVASQNDFSIVRVNQEFGNRSSVGVMYVERDGDGSVLNNSSDDYNRTYAVDGRWGIGDTTLISGFAARTDTPGVNSRDGSLAVNADFNTPAWSIDGGYAQVGENFNPEVGFLSRSGYRKIDFGVRYHYRPDDLWGLLELRPHFSYRGFWDFDGNQETGYLHVDNHWEFRSGFEFHTGVNFTQEGVMEPFEIVSGVTVPVGEYRHEEGQLVVMTNQGAPLSINVRSHFGGFFGGDRVTFEPTVRYRIGEKFSTELTWIHSDIDLPVPGGDFEVDVARLRLSYSFTPSISLQTLVQYNKREDVIATNIRFAWLQSANAGLYLVYNEIDESGVGAPRSNARQFILKYSRIINIFN
ncbi:MAG: carbohydrate binding family 9 domain-containing protein [Gammaproteobacteria bacterium]|nr:carbohydrate binding family 9 domain-containing protein [Gammaproteobacteria bacterium]